MEYFTFDLLTLLINIFNATLSIALICKFPSSELDVFTYFCFALWINVNPK